MRATTLLVSIILAGAAGARAEVSPDSERAAWLARLGLETSGGSLVYARAFDGAPERFVLSAEQALTIDALVARLEAAPDPDAVLREIAERELGAEGRAPGAAASDGTIWLVKAADGWRLTDAGRKAVPGIVLDRTSAAAAAPGAPARALALELPASRIRSALDGAALARFDGAADASAASDAGTSPVPLQKLPDAPKPRPSAVERDLFWSTWWGYHAAFAADFTTTGMVIGRGGYETDHLYTQFGNKNMGGVIGSATAVHVVASLASLALYREAQTKHGVWRRVLDAAAIGINAYGIGAHAEGAAHNVGVLQNWNAR
jgi:hypothetical protein